MTKTLPKELTSYDLLKSLAVILMVIDHIGHHFFPDEAWFRVMGRLCVPIWFFLIGYAKTEEIPKKLIAGAAIVALSALIAGQYVLPLNILVTIIFLRLMRRGVFARTFYSPETLRGMFLIMLFLTLPSAIFVEYGSFAFLFVILGHICRYREVMFERIKPVYIHLYTAATFFAFFVLQGVAFANIDVLQSLFLFLGLAGVAVMLWRFRPVVYTDAPRFIAPSFISAFQFMGRYTLEIYVVHIVVFRAVCMYLYPEVYGFLDIKIVPQALLSFVLR